MACDVVADLVAVRAVARRARDSRELQVVEPALNRADAPTVPRLRRPEVVEDDLGALGKALERLGLLQGVSDVLTGTGTPNSPELLNHLIGFESFDAIFACVLVVASPTETVIGSDWLDPASNVRSATDILTRSEQAMLAQAKPTPTE